MDPAGCVPAQGRKPGPSPLPLCRRVHTTAEELAHTGAHSPEQPRTPSVSRPRAPERVTASDTVPGASGRTQKGPDSYLKVARTTSRSRRRQSCRR
ncbi:piercer of microtubule wall 2 protein isoform X2 [Notamacropus eugenii]|uniref:piercer of microtubule wall 2 protein isoform X2 n=1 Tax=Notamacropus eugenii TaxID=9315 RepID=UPI003B6782E3